MQEDRTKFANTTATSLHVLAGIGFLLASQAGDFREMRLGVAWLLWLGGLFFQLTVATGRQAGSGSSRFSFRSPPGTRRSGSSCSSAG